METKGHYFLVGLFTLTLSLGIVFFLSWMMRTDQVSGEFKKLLFYFPANINGLSEGSEVQYRGVKVGNIVKIAIDPTQPQHVLVMSHVQMNTPLRVDTKATIASMGITGLTYIELETEDNNAPELTLAAGKEYYVLIGQQSQFNKLMEQVPIMIDRYTEVGNRLISLLDKKNIEAASKALFNLENFTQNLVGRQKEVDQILVGGRDAINELDFFLRDARKATSEIKELTKMLEENPSSLIYQPKYNGYQVEQ